MINYRFSLVSEGVVKALEKNRCGRVILEIHNTIPEILCGTVVIFSLRSFPIRFLPGTKYLEIRSCITDSKDSLDFC